MLRRAREIQQALEEDLRLSHAFLSLSNCRLLEEIERANQDEIYERTERCVAVCLGVVSITTDETKREKMWRG